MSDEQMVCDVRRVTAAEGDEIPIPIGGIGLADGAILDIRRDAEVQIHPRTERGWYVVVNAAEESNGEAAELFTELSVEGAIHTLEELAIEAIGVAASFAIEAVGLLAGVLVSVFTTSKLTREIFIRATLEDETPITYCILA